MSEKHEFFLSQETNNDASGFQERLIVGANIGQ